MEDTLNCIVLTILAGGAVVSLIVAFTLAVWAGRNKKLRNKTGDL